MHRAGGARARRRLHRHRALRRTLERLRGRRPAARQAPARVRDPAARHLLRHAGDGLPDGRPRGAGPASGVRQGAPSAPGPRGPAGGCGAGARRPRDRVDEPRRHRAASLRRASRAWPPPTTARSRPWPTRRGGSSRCSSIPRWRTPPRARRCSRISSDAAGAHADWSMPSFVDSAVEGIRRQVGKDPVLCALSGGVDSSVVAALIHRAVGDQLTCLFVDNGLLRKGEGDGGRPDVPGCLQDEPDPHRCK